MIDTSKQSLPGFTADLTLAHSRVLTQRGAVTKRSPTGETWQSFCMRGLARTGWATSTAIASIFIAGCGSAAGFHDGPAADVHPKSLATHVSSADTSVTVQHPCSGITQVAVDQAMKRSMPPITERVIPAEGTPGSSTYISGWGDCVAGSGADEFKIGIFPWDNSYSESPDEPSDQAIGGGVEGFTTSGSPFIVKCRTVSRRYSILATFGSGIVDAAAATALVRRVCQHS